MMRKIGINLEKGEKVILLQRDFVSYPWQRLSAGQANSATCLKRPVLQLIFFLKGINHWVFFRYLSIENTCCRLKGSERNGRTKPEPNKPPRSHSSDWTAAHHVTRRVSVTWPALPPPIGRSGAKEEDPCGRWRRSQGDVATSPLPTKWNFCSAGPLSSTHLDQCSGDCHLTQVWLYSFVWWFLVFFVHIFVSSLLPPSFPPFSFFSLAVSFPCFSIFLSRKAIETRSKTTLFDHLGPSSHLTYTFNTEGSASRTMCVAFVLGRWWIIRAERTSRQELVRISRRKIEWRAINPPTVCDAFREFLSVETRKNSNWTLI